MLRLAFIGNLGKDPELRYNQDGNPHLRFSVAAQFGVRLPDGSWDNRTEWVNVVVFGPRAERLQGTLTKGQRVYVDGKLQVRPWTDRSNEPRAGLEVMADAIEMMSAPQPKEDDPAVSDRDYRDVPEGQLPF